MFHHGSISGEALRRVFEEAKKIMENGTPEFFFHFTIEDKPHSQARPRLGRSGCVYDPSFQVKKRIKEELTIQWADTIEKNGMKWKSAFDSCLEYHLEMEFTFFPPSSCGEKEAARKLWGFIPYTKKPDLDNMAKLYLDCLVPDILKDDKLVTKLSVSKSYGQEDKTEIKIVGVEMSDEELKTREIISTFTPEEISSLAGMGDDLSFALKEEWEKLDEKSLKDILVRYSHFWKQFQKVFFLECEHKRYGHGRIPC